MSNGQPSQNTVKTDDIALLLGRFAMAILFLPHGIDKLFNYNKFAASMIAKSLPFGIALPFPELMIILAVAIEVAGPILLIFGMQTRWVSLVMIAFLIMATLTTHRYWEFEDPARAMQSGQFYKNLALIGGLLFLYVSGAGRYSWDGYRGRRNHRETTM
jgi:putative oxidoreductase